MIPRLDHTSRIQLSVKGWELLIRRSGQFWQGPPDPAGTLLSYPFSGCQPFPSRNLRPASLPAEREGKPQRPAPRGLGTPTEGPLADLEAGKDQEIEFHTHLERWFHLLKVIF